METALEDFEQTFPRGQPPKNPDRCVAAFQNILSAASGYMSFSSTTERHTYSLPIDESAAVSAIKGVRDFIDESRNFSWDSEVLIDQLKRPTFILDQQTEQSGWKTLPPSFKSSDIIVDAPHQIWNAPESSKPVLTIKRSESGLEAIYKGSTFVLTAQPPRNGGGQLEWVGDIKDGDETAKIWVKISDTARAEILWKSSL